MTSPHYIGAGPTYGQFVKQAITTATVGPHLLVQNAPSVESLLVVQAGAVLNPGVDYTIQDSGSRILFNAGKTPSVSNTWILFQGQSLLNTSVAAAEQDNFTGDNTTVAFVLTSLPYSADNLIVFVDGIAQSYTTNWTLSGSTITFTSAPSTGSLIDVTHLKVAQAGAWVEIPSTVSAFTAVASGKYLVTPPGGGTTVTLPAGAAVGTEVTVRRLHATNAVSVAASVNIGGSASPYTVSANAGKTFVYAGSYGWSVE